MEGLYWRGMVALEILEMIAETVVEVLAEEVPEDALVMMKICERVLW